MGFVGSKGSGLVEPEVLQRERERERHIYIYIYIYVHIYIYIFNICIGDGSRVYGCSVGA